MKNIIIFGKTFEVIEQKSKKDLVKVEGNSVVVEKCKKPADYLIEDYLAGLLYSELFKILNEIKDDGKIEIFGNLDFEVTDKIDNKKERVAKLKGNTIVVKINAIALPRDALRYVIAHEIAHTVVKKHTRKFWDIVKTIHPSFEVGKELLVKYGSFL